MIRTHNLLIRSQGPGSLTLDLKCSPYNHWVRSFTVPPHIGYGFMSNPSDNQFDTHRKVESLRCAYLANTLSAGVIACRLKIS